MDEGWRLERSNKEAMDANWEAADEEVSLLEHRACKLVPGVWKSATVTETKNQPIQNMLCFRVDGVL